MQRDKQIKDKNTRGIGVTEWKEEKNLTQKTGKMVRSIKVLFPEGHENIEVK